MTSETQTVGAWAARFMPLTAMALERAIDTGSLAEIAITLDIHLDSKSLSFAQMLKNAGCDVGFLHGAPDKCAPFNVWDTPRGIILGDTNVAMADQGDRYVDLGNSPLRTLLEDKIGIGQAAVMALVDITNLQLAGRPIGVIGYSVEAKSIADYAMALGARVTVIEPNAVTAVTALFDGHTIAKDADAIRQMDVVFVTSKSAAAMVSRRMQSLRNGVLICNVAPDVSRDDFAGLSGGVAVRDHVTTYQLENGNSIKLIADGAPIQFAAAEGYPIEVSDAKFALLVGAIEQLRSGTTEAAQQTLSQGRESLVAEAILKRHQNKLVGDVGLTS